MDGPSGSLGNRVALPGLEPLNTKDVPTQELHDIFVRAHTRVPTSGASDGRWSRKWPTYCLVFDTETTLDPAQKLNFGVFRRCKLVGSKYVCVAEGIFYKDDISETALKLLQQYKMDPPTLATVEHFPAETTLGLMSRSSFVRRAFWNSVRKGELIISFNSPFDLSPLAVWYRPGEKGTDWSLP